MKISHTWWQVLGLVRLDRQKNLLAHRPRVRWALLLAVPILIVAWQASFWQARDILDGEYVSHHITGGAQLHEVAGLFYAAGLFPAKFLSQTPKNLNADNAWQILRAAPRNVGFVATQDRAGLWLYWPDIKIRGDYVAPHYVAGNAMILMAGLVAFYVGMWLIRLEIAGLFFVALFGSNPYLIFETYNNNNIFGLVISMALLLLGLHLPLLSGHRYFFNTKAPWRRAYLWALPIVTGIAVALSMNVRQEVAAIGLAVALTYLFLGVGMTRQQRAGLLALFALSAVVTNSSINHYFDSLTRQSVVAGKQLGLDPGKVGLGWPRGHQLWHNFWAGLGDLDTKYGYIWDDVTVFSYAAPRLAALGRNEPQPYLPSFFRKSNDRILKADVAGRIISDPGWYAEILLKRANRILFENTPPRLAASDGFVQLPLGNWFLYPATFLVLAAGLLRFDRLILGTVMFLVAAGAVAFSVTTIGGYHYSAVVHLSVYAFFFAWLLEGALIGLAARKPPQSVQEFRSS